MDNKPYPYLLLKADPNVTLMAGGIPSKGIALTGGIEVADLGFFVDEFSEGKILFRVRAAFVGRSEDIE
jgi:hypothetical protein